MSYLLNAALRRRERRFESCRGHRTSQGANLTLRGRTCRGVLVIGELGQSVCGDSEDGLHPARSSDPDFVDERPHELLGDAIRATVDCVQRAGVERGLQP